MLYTYETRDLSDQPNVSAVFIGEAGKL
jgi:hypothetical protein